MWWWIPDGIYTSGWDSWVVITTSSTSTSNPEYLGEFEVASDKDLADIAELERMYALKDERD